MLPALHSFTSFFLKALPGSFAKSILAKTHVQIQRYELLKGAQNYVICPFDHQILRFKLKYLIFLYIINMRKDFQREIIV